MITDFILEMFFGFFDWFTSLFPPFEMPVWMSDLSININIALSWLADFEYWLDWKVILAVGTSILSVYGIVFYIRFIRAIATYIPTIGGGGA